MTHWLKRLRGAVLTGLTWAVGWGFVGGLMELFVDPHGQIADIWPMVLALPGFFGGVIFSLVLSMAEPGRSFEERRA